MSDSTLKLNASAGPLDVSSARFLANSGTAQAEKLELIGAAGRKIIFSALDFGADGAALRLADKLLAAARRGAEVQLLLDFTRSYAQLDLLIALEQAGNLGRGSLKVRLFNRPSDTIIKQAAMLMAGCDG
ncbi:MAG TPA: hypothetical protein PLP17_07490, partial [Oligoflexia bacterium]|nr:hypothetical protein [Oligoflexia bacterium]